MSPEGHMQPQGDLAKQEAPSESTSETRIVSSVPESGITNIADAAAKKAEAQRSADRLAQAKQELNTLYGAPVDNLTSKQQEVFWDQKLARYEKELAALENGGDYRREAVTDGEGQPLHNDNRHGIESIPALEATLRETFGIADVDAYLAEIDRSKMAALKAAVKGLMNGEFGETMHTLRYKRAERKKILDTVAKINEVRGAIADQQGQAHRKAA